MALTAIAPVGQAMLDGRSSPEILGFELRILLRGLDTAGGATSDFVERIGIVDTGASHVHIDRKAAKQLGLRAHDKRPAEIASGERLLAVVYNGVIEAPDIGISLIAEFYSFEDGSSFSKGLSLPPKVLIGRSVLRHFLVTFDGPSGIVTFARPSSHYSLPVDDE